MTPEIFEKAQVLHAARTNLSKMLKYLESDTDIIIIVRSAPVEDTINGLLPWLECPPDIRGSTLAYARKELADIDQQLKDL